MSILLDKVKKQQQSLRLLKNSENARYQAEALTVVLGEVGRMDKAKVTDESVLKVIKKVYDGILETLKLLPEGNGQEFALSNQKAVLEDYLPKMLSEEEIRQEARALLLSNAHGENGFKWLSVGEVQRHFKNNFSQRYDGKVVGNIYNELTK